MFKHCKAFVPNSITFYKDTNTPIINYIRSRYIKPWQNDEPRKSKYFYYQPPPLNLWDVYGTYIFHTYKKPNIFVSQIMH